MQFCNCNHKFTWHQFKRLVSNPFSFEDESEAVLQCSRLALLEIDRNFRSDLPHSAEHMLYFGKFRYGDVCINDYLEKAYMCCILGLAILW